MSRRWLVLLILTVAAILLAGRVLSGWYVDHQWFALHGASRLWWVKAMNLGILRGAVFGAVAVFAFANLFAVRRSVRSLRLPRRIGNLEFSEEVSARILNRSAVMLSLAIAAVFALPHDDWMSIELIRNGLPFGETDPYFRLDLGAWMYALPLEHTAHLTAMIALVAIALLVVFLYALTPSLRWESGQLQVSGHVRRHLSVLAGVLLLLLAWSYRLDAFGLLREGTGPLGALSAMDHRLGIPANLTLAMLAVASAMLVTWTGWVGQTRVAFATITVMLLATLTVRQLAPAIGERFVVAADPDAQEQSYREIRNAYSRRAYALDAIERTGLAEAQPRADALRGASLWDTEAMRRALGLARQGARPNGAVGWHGQDGRLVALALERPLGTNAVDSLPDWGITRVAADVADDRGGPVTRDDPIEGRAVPSVLVHDSATTYYVLSDTAGRIVARSLDTMLGRLAHAWHLQNTSLLARADQEDAPRVLLRRDVRERVRLLYPFLDQGSRVTPVVWRDSVYWAVHLYATSDWYPLSSPQRMAGTMVRYAQQAGVAIVNGHTGRVTALAAAGAGPLAQSWIARFPELFADPTSFERGFLIRLPPPGDLAAVVAHVVAQSGFRGEFETRAHLPETLGDTLYSPVDPAPWLDRQTGAVAIAIPLLDPRDEIRGILIAPGGVSFRLRWLRAPPGSPRWSRLAMDLQAAVDSFRTGDRSIRPFAGPLRVLLTSDGLVAVQTHYVQRPDGAPQVLVTGISSAAETRVGRTFMDAAGLPHPVEAVSPLTEAEFRRRVGLLYESMREAMRRGDWIGIGAAYEALGRLLRSPPP